MATIRQLIGAEATSELFDLSDKLDILLRDPLRMNRTQFEKYLAAKAEAMILADTSNGIEIDRAYGRTQMWLTLLDAQWREEAKLVNIHRHNSRDMLS